MNWDTVVLVLTIMAALAAGTVGGVFFAFSTFVMPALARLPAPIGLRAMQSINVAVINPSFMTPFMGGAALCVATASLAALRRTDPGALWLFIGSALYLLGCFGVTIVCNVPRNNAMARLDPDDPASAEVWAAYCSSWTGWNHIRATASLGAAVCFMLALRS